MSPADNLRGNGRDLGGCLAETQHDFRKALPDGSMVIDLGKPKILKGLLSKRSEDSRAGGLRGRYGLREDPAKV